MSQSLMHHSTMNDSGNLLTLYAYKIINVILIMILILSFVIIILFYIHNKEIKKRTNVK